MRGKKNVHLKLKPTTVHKLKKGKKKVKAIAQMAKFHGQKGDEGAKNPMVVKKVWVNNALQVRKGGPFFPQAKTSKRKVRVY